MLVLAVICVMLATQPAPPPRSRRSRLPDQVAGRRPANEGDGVKGSSTDDDPPDHRFTALHASGGTPALTGSVDGQQRSPGGRINASAAEAALALWPANGNAIR
jgi:hypothetical protein